MMARLVCIVATALLALGAAREQSIVIDHLCVDEHDRIIPSDALNRARKLKVVLGHESVGFNVIQGLQDLSRTSERYRLDFGPQIRSDWYRQHSGLGEFFVGHANDIPAKVATFDEKLKSGVGEAVDVASLKLCWADLQQRSDADSAFKAYTQAIEKWQQQYPRVKFVYWSMPLRREAMLGEKRQRFNSLMADYAKKHTIVLCDIADIESHKPDGGDVKDENGRPAMFADYTDDGGHLNDAGKQRAARAWWWLLARVSGWSGPKNQLNSASTPP